VRLLLADAVLNSARRPLEKALAAPHDSADDAR